LFFLSDELEQSPGGMEESVARGRVFQVIKALAFCHANSVRMSINVVFSSSTELERKSVFLDHRGGFSVSEKATE
jgi:hypothetical protein